MNQNINLIEQLRNFGLNPNYWILQKLKAKHSWMIINKKDKELCLKGKTKSKKIDWDKLEWCIK